MKKVITGIIFWFLLFVAVPVEAQRFGASVVAGLNASQVDGDKLAGYHKLGLNLGLKSSVYLSDRFDLNIEFLYSERGSINPKGIEQIKLQYIELPVLLNYMDWLSDDEMYYRLQFYGGVSVGRLFQAKFIDNSGFLTQFEDVLQKNDLSWIGGFLYKVNLNWGFGARYTASLNRLSKGDGSDTLPDLRGYFLTFRVEYSIL